MRINIIIILVAFLSKSFRAHKIYVIYYKEDLNSIFFFETDNNEKSKNIVHVIPWKKMK